MDLFELETFLAVVREGGFSRAAKALHRTQPAVSQTIRKLEDDLGEPLLDRSSRDGTLTDAGRLLEEYAQRMLNLKGEARAALTELRQLTHGKLVIAANEYTCMYLLPALNEFHRQYPMIKIEVQRSLASHIPGDLTRHEAELGVLSFDPGDAGLASVVVGTDVLAFVVHPRHPLAKAKQVSIKQLGAGRLAGTTCRRRYGREYCRRFKSTRRPCTCKLNCRRLRRSNGSWRWATAWRWCQAFACKLKLLGENWCVFL